MATEVWRKQSVIQREVEVAVVEQKWLLSPEFLSSKGMKNFNAH